eukprot:SAG11_NODE_1224_length_5481_cov_3.755853_3_plen_104_part_00
MERMRAAAELEAAELEAAELEAAELEAGAPARLGEVRGRRRDAVRPPTTRRRWGSRPPEGGRGFVAGLGSTRVYMWLFVCGGLTRNSPAPAGAQVPPVRRRYL